MKTRHMKMTHYQRLHSANEWIKVYDGKNFVKGYSKKYGVDLICAVKELEQLNIQIDSKYKTDLIHNINNVHKIKNHKVRKSISNN